MAELRGADSSAQPTNSIDSELEVILNGIVAPEHPWFDPKKAVEQALQAIKALYVRKEDCKCVKNTADTVHQNT